MSLMNWLTVRTASVPDRPTGKSSSATSTSTDPVDSIPEADVGDDSADLGSKSVSSSNGQGKRKSYDTATSTVKSKKSKHAHGFHPNWKKNRQWLSYIEGKGMFCTLCQKHDIKPFDRDVWNKQPCRRLRLESVVDHERSNGHETAERLEIMTIEHEDLTVAIFPTVNMHEMKKLFSCVYFLVKQRIAHTTNLEPLLNLLDYLEVKVQVGVNGPAYTSRSSIQDILYCMSDYLENKTINELTQTENFSLLFDVTTDCTVSEQMILRARYICPGGDNKILENN